MKGWMVVFKVDSRQQQLSRITLPRIDGRVTHFIRKRQLRSILLFPRSIDKIFDGQLLLLLLLLRVYIQHRTGRINDDAAADPLPIVLRFQFHSPESWIGFEKGQNQGYFSVSLLSLAKLSLAICGVLGGCWLCCCCFDPPPSRFGATTKCFDAGHDRCVKTVKISADRNILVIRMRFIGQDL